MTTVLLSISLGFILSPIVENLFMIQSTTDIINVNVIGATYVVTLLIGVAGIPALTGEVNSIYPLPGEMVVLYLTYVFLLARAHHIIHVAFNQETGLFGFAISLVPLALFVLPQIQYISQYIEQVEMMKKVHPLMLDDFHSSSSPFLPVMHVQQVHFKRRLNPITVFLDQTTLHVKNRTNLTFTIEVQSATVAMNTVMLVINGTELFKQLNLLFATNLSGNGDTEHGSAMNQQHFESSLITFPTTMFATSKTIFPQFNIPIPEEIIISPWAAASCQDLTTTSPTFHFFIKQHTLAFTTNATNLNMQGSPLSINPLAFSVAADTWKMYTRRNCR